MRNLLQVGLARLRPPNPDFVSPPPVPPPSPVASSPPPRFMFPPVHRHVVRGRSFALQQPLWSKIKKLIFQSALFLFLSQTLVILPSGVCCRASECLRKWALRSPNNRMEHPRAHANKTPQISPPMTDAVITLLEAVKIL